MAFGAYPDPVSVPEDFGNALFSTMLAPMAGTETGEFYQPRRPRFLLLDPK
jgi:hypothetical protein